MDISYLLVGIELIAIVAFGSILLLHLLNLPVVLVLNQISSCLGITQLYLVGND